MAHALLRAAPRPETRLDAGQPAFAFDILKTIMRTRLGILLALLSSIAFCGDWNPRLAADYLDSRQKEWFAWPSANSAARPCVSCHTGVSYLLARPALGRALGETGRSPYETGLLDSLRARVDQKDVANLFPKSTPPHSIEAMGVETVFAALFLATEDARQGKMSAATENAFDRLWALQIRDGENKGAWVWNSFNLDPWEMPESTYFGAALAGVAAGTAPGGYAGRPAIQENLNALKKYLLDHQSSQPQHNKLMLLWAEAKLPGLLLPIQAQNISKEILDKQQPDGGWTLASLGPWKQHKDAPPSEGSSAYATAFTAFALQKAGFSRTQPGIAKALAWLRAHQDPKTGVWAADSMNHPHKADTMPAKFMQDAATGYAAAALLGTK